MNSNSENMHPQTRVVPPRAQAVNKSFHMHVARDQKGGARQPPNRHRMAPKRRALGDITNRAEEAESANSSANSSSTKTAFHQLGEQIGNKTTLPFGSSRTRLRIPTDHCGQIADVEILPLPLVEVAHTPMLFDDEQPLATEEDSAHNETHDESQDELTLDLMGVPYVKSAFNFGNEIQIPCDPANMIEQQQQLQLQQQQQCDSDLLHFFHRDQLIANDDFSTLELA